VTLELLKAIAAWSLGIVALVLYLRHYTAARLRRVRFISELYAKVHRSVVALKDASSPDLTESERTSQLETATSTCGDMRDFMQEKRVLLSEKLCRTLDELWGVLEDTSAALQDATDPDLSSQQRASALDQARAIVQDVLPAFQTQVELECRRLIYSKPII